MKGVDPSGVQALQAYCPTKSSSTVSASTIARLSCWLLLIILLEIS